MFFQVIDLLFTVYYFMILVRIVGSWIPEIQRYTFMHFIYHYTEPYLRFFRERIPPIGVIDISVFVAMLALGFLKFLLLNFL